MKADPIQAARNTAAVCRTEAEVRRLSPLAHQRAFAAVLDTWAANQERRAGDLDRGGQPDLFEVAA